MKRFSAVSLAAAVIGLALGSGVSVTTAADAGAPDAEGFDGLVKPARRVVLHAPGEERVADLAVREGDRVATGQMLVQMDDAVQQALVERAALQALDETPVKFAELGLEEAGLRLDQVTRAFEGEAANELEVISARVAKDQAQVRLDAAREELKRAQVELELEKRRLARYRIEAPFDAVVVDVVSDEGARLTREEPILELASLDPLEAEVHLPAEAYGRLAIGESYTLQASPPVDAALAATLDRVVPTIDPGSRTFKAVFVIENPAMRLPSGFSVLLPPTALEAHATPSARR